LANALLFMHKSNRGLPLQEFAPATTWIPNEIPMENHWNSHWNSHGCRSKLLQRPFDPKAPEKKGNAQDKQGFRYLGDRYKDVGMLDGKCILKRFCSAKIIQEGLAKCICDLQRSPQ
jgi:hypothetical protein